MSHLPLDARAILHYLNELGYRNISATQLKEFLKDLRKLIKYEDRLGVNTHQNDYYESLFRRTTASYRAKIDPENDKRDQCKRKSFETNKPTGSRPAATEKRKVLGERNHGETPSTSRDVLDWTQKSANQIHSRSLKSPTEKKTEEIKINSTSIKALIEKTLTQILHDKYSQEFVERNENISKEATPIKFLVEQALKEKLTNFSRSAKETLNFSEPESLRSIIEDIVTQVLKEKLPILQKERIKSIVQNKDLENLNLDLQTKLNISNEPITILPREPVTHYNCNKSLDSQALVQQLLANDDKINNNKPNKNSKANKENSTTVAPACGIKRIQRISRKKPEWKEPSLHDNILEKPQKPQRSRSPVASSSARSGRSKCASSVLIRRSASQGRHNKPNSDPVALYQYYKNEWEHFREQIPGETPHNRLRWQLRQRLLNPE